ncbi:leucine-rich repeat-containing G-protein coupled receptor 5-like isoform X3 [Siniperca chuatsi]|uniref:leucine-rich repeat-containing G-protein coupled receptor 5-like isoform X3 n=1 Tax=Siniperca chuatsi TaxID=119488 RepID=UPI001CE194EE|nr:leucine-rich repeat-containing G-protein coupled receptor 5-like isoform X3 [Siniperca chuatsi]
MDSHTHFHTHTPPLHACSLESDQTAHFNSDNLDFLFDCFIFFVRHFQSRLGEVNLQSDSTSGGGTAEDMPGFVALLAAFAVLSAGLRSSVAAVEMQSSVAVQESSAVPAVERTAAAGVNSSGDGDRGAGRAGCPGRCRCEVDGLLHRVDCLDLGLREIPSNLSVFTSYLDLSMNNLTVLSSGALSNLHFLEELRLAGNDLSFIPRGAFTGLYNLKVLMLQNNQLKTVPAEAFSNLHNLQSLRLDANHISGVPVGCFSGLRSLRHLWLDDNSLTEVPVEALGELPALQAMTLALNHISHVPDHAFSKLGRLVVLHLNNNRIVSMGTNCFHGLHSLETLDLNYNSLVEFPTAIRSLSHLKELGFHSNNIQSIPEHAFTGNPSLITIFFYDNPIQSVGRSAFQNLPELRTLSLNGAADLTEFPDLTGTKSLESLTITGARITSLPSSVCEQLPNLQLLDLSYNQIQTLPSFSGCESVQKIDLHHNEIEELEENTFHGLMSLRSLDLSWNRLSSVKPNSFSALPALTKLDLSSNRLSSLPLIGLQSLTHLRLAGNSQLMELIPREDLPRVRVMELPYAFQCCAFVSCERRGGGGGGGGSSWEREEAADSTGKETSVLSSQDQDWEDFLMEFEDEPKLLHSVHCSPAPGPFRPCLHLLGSWLIRGGVWLIAALSLVSNSLVVLSVFFSPATSVTPPKLLIGLLALVNGLMGVWSGWLAAVDAWTFGSFWRYGARWESSFLCRLSGFLCVFASQTGLFLLTIAALERCLAAARHHKPDGHNGRSLSPLSVRLAVCLCFLLGLAVTLPPLVAGHSSTSLCLSLPSSSSSSSLAFSVSLVLLDSLCFLLMTLAYTRLYCRANKAPPAAEEEVALTRHVAWLLFSDCLLYLPVAFLSFSSLLRLSAAGPEAAKGMLLLVAPLPACVNPLLYILFNPLARQELAALAKRTCGAVGVPRLGRGGGGGAGGRPNVMDSTYDEDAEKQSCDSTQALVAIGGTKDEEEEERGRGRSEAQHSVAFVVPHH